MNDMVPYETYGVGDIIGSIIRGRADARPFYLSRKGGAL